LIFDVNPGVRTRVGLLRVEAAPIAPEALLDRVDLKPDQPFERSLGMPREHQLQRFVEQLSPFLVPT